MYESPRDANAVVLKWERCWGPLRVDDAGGCIGSGSPTDSMRGRLRVQDLKYPSEWSTKTNITLVCM